MNIELKLLYSQLTSIFSFEHLQVFLNNVKHEEDLLSSIKFKKVLKKLSLLIRHKDQTGNHNKKFSDFVIHERVKNLSNVSFNDEEMSLLNLGLKFACSHVCDKTLVDLCIELDVLIEKLSPNTNLKKSNQKSLYRSHIQNEKQTSFSKF